MKNLVFVEGLNKKMDITRYPNLASLIMEAKDWLAEADQGGSIDPVGIVISGEKRGSKYRFSFRGISRNASEYPEYMI